MGESPEVYRFALRPSRGLNKKPVERLAACQRQATERLCDENGDENGDENAGDENGDPHAGAPWRFPASEVLGRARAYLVRSGLGGLLDGAHAGAGGAAGAAFAGGDGGGGAAAAMALNDAQTRAALHDTYLAAPVTTFFAEHFHAHWELRVGGTDPHRTLGSSDQVSAPE